MLGIQVIALPKGYRTQHTVMTAVALNGFLKDCQSQFQNYPVAMPWTSRVPKSGPRKGGKRTGALGQHWSMEYISMYEGRLTNRLGYAGYVEGYTDHGRSGERQTGVMARRRWPNITNVANTTWKKWLPNVAKSFSVIRAR